MTEWSAILTPALTIFGFVVAGIGFFYAQRASMTLIVERLSILGGRMINMESKLEKLTDVVSQIAVERERLNAVIASVDDLKEFQTWAREKLDRIETRDRGHR